MIVGDRVPGHIGVQNVERFDAFSDAELRLLQTLASSRAWRSRTRACSPRRSSARAELDPSAACSQRLSAQARPRRADRARRATGADGVQAPTWPYVGTARPRARGMIDFPYRRRIEDDASIAYGERPDQQDHRERPGADPQLATSTDARQRASARRCSARQARSLSRRADGRRRHEPGRHQRAERRARRRATTPHDQRLLETFADQVGDRASRTRACSTRRRRRAPPPRPRTRPRARSSRP